jgi:hypothetical protein
MLAPAPEKNNYVERMPQCRSLFRSRPMPASARFLREEKMTELQGFAAVLPLIAFVLLAAYAVRENRKLK